MVWDNQIGLMDLLIKVTIIKESFMAQGFIHEIKVNITMDNGRMEKWVAMEN